MKTPRTVVKHGHNVVFCTAKFGRVHHIRKKKSQTTKTKKDGEHKAGKMKLRIVSIC